jgi:hypothetical protein
MSFGQTRQVYNGEGKGVECESGVQETKHIMSIVFDEGGSVSSNLCFGLVSHTTKKVLVMFGRKRRQQRRRRQKSR